MSNSLRTLEDYELFLYTLTEQFPAIRRSTVALVRLGATLARVAGELHFDYGIRLVVRERLVCHRQPVVIDWYGYEVWRGDEKLYWADPRDRGSHQRDGQWSCAGVNSFRATDGLTSHWSRRGYRPGQLGFLVLCLLVWLIMVINQEMGF